MLIRVVKTDVQYLIGLSNRKGYLLSIPVMSNQWKRGIRLRVKPRDKRKGLAILHGVGTKHGLIGLKMMNRVVNLGFFFSSPHDRQRFIRHMVM